MVKRTNGGDRMRGPRGEREGKEDWPNEEWREGSERNKKAGGQ